MIAKLTVFLVVVGVAHCGILGAVPSHGPLLGAGHGSLIGSGSRLGPGITVATSTVYRNQPVQSVPAIVKIPTIVPAVGIAGSGLIGPGHIGGSLGGHNIVG